MRFLDISILLCIALKQPKEHFDGCKTLLEKLKTTNNAKPKEKVATTFLTPAIFYSTLESTKNLPKNRITTAMKALQALNIKILTLKDGALMEEAAIIAEKYNIKFDTAVNTITMRETDIEEIYALDKDYDKIEWVERIIPTAE